MSTIKGITTLSSLRIDPVKHNQAINGFYLPQLTVAQRNAIPFNANPTKSILRGGALIFTTDAVGAAPNQSGITQLYQRNGWGAIFTTTTAATGAGLANGSSPFGLPSGELGNVEAGGNDEPGFIYYDSTVDSRRPFRARNGTQWTTLFASFTAATGEGLSAGYSLLSVPHGPRADVETAAGNPNNHPGFIYWDTTNNVFRARGNAAWGTLALT